jgi:hypothetical protein
MASRWVNSTRALACSSGSNTNGVVDTTGRPCRRAAPPSWSGTAPRSRYSRACPAGRTSAASPAWPCARRCRRRWWPAPCP